MDACRISFSQLVVSLVRDNGNRHNLIVDWLSQKISWELQIPTMFMWCWFASTPGSPRKIPFRFHNWIIDMVIVNFTHGRSAGYTIALVAPAPSNLASSSSYIMWAGLWTLPHGTRCGWWWGITSFLFSSTP